MLKYSCQHQRSIAEDKMPEFKALLEGYRRFRTGAYQEQRRRYDALADKGQQAQGKVTSSQQRCVHA